MLVSFRGLLSSIISHNSSDIERYTIVLDIMDTILGGRNLFSVNMILKTAGDAVPPQPSPTEFYPDVFEGPPLSHDFSDLQVPICPNSNLPGCALQSYSDFQCGARMPSWNVHNYFDPAATYVPYTSFGDAQFMATPEPDLPPSYHFS